MAGRSRAVLSKLNLIKAFADTNRLNRKLSFVINLITFIFRFKEIDLNCAVQLRNKNHIYVYEPDHIGDESEDEEDQEWQLAENEENGTMGEEEDESGVGRVF